MEGVICLSIRFIPTVLVSNTLHILPQSLVSMERKVGARRDTSKESDDGEHQFFFNKRVEDVDGKHGWQGQSKARRQFMEFGITSRVNGKADLAQRSTCLEKL